MTDKTPIDYIAFHNRQIESWPVAKANHSALGHCLTFNVSVNGTDITVMHNPGRIRSSAADTSTTAIAARRCFLCRDNRPPQQTTMDCGDYELLVNPYPIFTPHFTIAAKRHTPQAIAGKVVNMLEFAMRLPGLTVFYNGPHSGASAPDHLHFQAVPSDRLPIWKSVDEGHDWPLSHIQIFTHTDIKRVAELTEGYIWSLSPGREPDINLYARTTTGGLYQTIVIPRAAHRPHNHGTEAGQTLVSPASAEMAGVIVAPRMADAIYCSDPENIRAIFSECGMPADAASPARRTLAVGIVRAEKITVRLNGSFTDAATGDILTDTSLDFNIAGNGDASTETSFSTPVKLIPLGPECSFTLSDVLIGIGFHWQQHEDQSFHGQLLLKPDGNAIQAINIVDTETYLRSVVSSEMNAAAPEEFLKAHAVISRSWVLAQIMPPAHLNGHPCTDTPQELVKWYDRDAHTGFDICADDHCQRYQGCTKASTPQVEAALRATCGEVLAFGNDLCDTRFSKCCGGVTELFSTCWQDIDLPYIHAIDDPFCGRASSTLLHRVLNNYDHRTTDGYYRWNVRYDADELADIIRRRTGIDFGTIIALTPLHRGPSGRIDRLEIRGTVRTRIIGKELEIRRTLSSTHLYSSAFNVHILEHDASGLPAKWELSGLGWGHGAGLCQIGAAQMADEGFDYRSILRFYFPGARIMTLYSNED